MQAKLSEEQFNMISETDYPNYLRKLNGVCVKKCAIDLIDDKHGGAEGQKHHYLSTEEAACVEACATLYVRSTDAIIGGFKSKLTY